MRSNWKGFFLHNSTNLDKSSTVFNTMLKKKFFIHDGKSQKPVVIERAMVGLKIGEFIFTRKVGVSHKKKVKNKKGKKN
jgi:ribosomal protein S19